MRWHGASLRVPTTARRHSRAGGEPVLRMRLNSRLRRNDLIEIQKFNSTPVLNSLQKLRARHD